MHSRHLLALLVVVATVVAAFPGQALAAPPLVAGISAEGMTLPAGASNARDRAADGGRAAQFTRNGTATTTLTTGADVTSLTLSARGTRCSSSWPQVQLTIDGVSVLSTVAGTTGWTTYPASGLNIPAGVHTISIVASNLASTRNCGRTVLVDLVSLYGADAPPPPPPTPIAGCAATIIPAYSYPNPPTFWDNGIAGANPVQIMIADPASGPGRTRDAYYTSVIARARAAGIRVMGYVDTNYARRSQSSMRADITTWKTLYDVTDIFFDQTASSTASAGLLPGDRGRRPCHAGRAHDAQPRHQRRRALPGDGRHPEHVRGLASRLRRVGPGRLGGQLPREALLAPRLRRPRRGEHDDGAQSGAHAPGGLRVHHERCAAKSVGRLAAVLDDRDRADPAGLCGDDAAPQIVADGAARSRGQAANSTSRSGLPAIQASASAGFGVPLGKPGSSSSVTIA